MFKERRLVAALFFVAAFMTGMIVANILTPDYVVSGWGNQSTPNDVKHLNFNAGSAKKIQWRGVTGYIWVHNKDASNGVEVSFDDGGNYWTVPKQTVSLFTVNKNNFYIRKPSGVDDVPVEIMVFRTNPF